MVLSMVRNCSVEDGNGGQVVRKTERQSEREQGAARVRKTENARGGGNGESAGQTKGDKAEI